MTSEGYHALCNGIIERAALDYRNASLGIRINRKPPTYTQKEVERFFHSDFFSSLTSLDGESLFNMLKQNTEATIEIRRKEREARRLKREITTREKLEKNTV